MTLSLLLWPQLTQAVTPSRPTPGKKLEPEKKARRGKASVVDQERSSSLRDTTRDWFLLPESQAASKTGSALDDGGGAWLGETWWSWWGALRTAERLRWMPGVQLRRGLANQNGLVVQGGAGHRVALRLDDIPLLIGLEGVEEWSVLPLLHASTLEGAALFRGPTSVSFGSGALGGAVGLWSRALPFSRDAWRVRGRLQADWSAAESAGGGDTAVSLAGRGFAMRLFGHWRRWGRLRPGQSEDTLPRTEHDRLGVGGSLRWAWSPRWHSKLHYRYSEVGPLMRTALFIPHGEYLTESYGRHLASLDINGRVEVWETRLRIVLAYQQHTREQIRDQVSLGQRERQAWLAQRWPVERLSLSIRGQSWPWKRWLALRYHAELLSDTSEVVITDDRVFQQGVSHAQAPYVRAEQQSASFGLQTELALLQQPLPVWLEAGLRVHLQGGRGQPVAPFAQREWQAGGGAIALALKARLHTCWWVSLRYHEGLRMPSLLERMQAGRQGRLFWLPSQSKAGDNAPLIPEEARAFTFTLRFKLRRRASATLRAYLQSRSQLVVSQTALWESNTSVEGRDVRQLQNIGQDRQMGASLNGYWRIWRGWHLDAQVVWQLPLSPTDDNASALWPVQPLWLYQTMTRYMIPSWGWFGISLRGTSTQAGVHTPTLANPLGQAVRADAALLLNLHGQLWVRPWMRLSVHIENLFDQRYTPYGSSLSNPGRHARFSLELLL